MNETEERVARALAHIERADVDDEHRLMARAAIAAMSQGEPVACKGCKGKGGHFGDGFDHNWYPCFDCEGSGEATPTQPVTEAGVRGARDLAAKMQKLGYAEFSDCMSLTAYRTILAALSTSPSNGDEPSELSGPLSNEKGDGMLSFPAGSAKIEKAFDGDRKQIGVSIIMLVLTEDVNRLPNPYRFSAKRVLAAAPPEAKPASENNSA